MQQLVIRYDSWFGLIRLTQRFTSECLRFQERHPIIHVLLHDDTTFDGVIAVIAVLSSFCTFCRKRLMASGQLVAVSSVWRLQIQRPLYYLVQVVVNSAITLYLQTCHINKIDLDFTTKLRFWALVSQSMTQVYQFEVDSYESNHPHIKSFSSWGDPRRYSHQRYEAKHRVFEAGHWLCTTGAVGQRINVHGAFHVVTRNLTFLQKRSRERERDPQRDGKSYYIFGLSFRFLLRISCELPVFLCWVSLNGRMTLSMKGTLAAVSWVGFAMFWAFWF